MQNRVFFPEQSLNEWLVEGTVDLKGSELTILAEARRYNLAEAVRVMGEVTGGPDTNDLVGRVKSKVYLQELGADLLETSMVLALHPELVRMQAAEDFESASRQRATDYAILGNGKSAKLGWAMQDYNAQGAAGNALAATAVKGRAVVEAAARQLALLLAEVARLPLSILGKDPV